MAKAKEIFNSAIAKNGLDDEELRTIESLTEHFPYFQQARLSLYKHLLATDDFKAENTLTKLSLMTYNRALLFELNEQTEVVGKKIQATLKNELAIPGFRFKISGSIEEADNDAPIISGNEPLIEYEPTPVYSLEREFKNKGTEKPRDRTAELIDGFLNQKRERKIPELKLKERIDDDSLKVPDDLVSETLAKIYVKQGKYSEAIQLYEKLMLLEPEKKSIFARSISEIKSKIE